MVMYKFLYDYVKPKYGGKAKLCFMDTDSFISAGDVLGRPLRAA